MNRLEPKPLAWFAKHADLGAVFIRLAVGFHLVYGSQDNVFSYARMLEFRDFLDGFGFPLPLLCAFVSVYAQFLAGLCFLVGFATRLAALTMVFNFVVAIFMVHLGDPYPRVFPALTMLSAALFLLFHGAGSLSLDRVLARRPDRR